MSEKIAVILPAPGFPLIILAGGIVGVLGERGIEFNAAFDVVAEHAVMSNREDLLSFLSHGEEKEDGSTVFVQYTPQGKRVETEADFDGGIVDPSFYPSESETGDLSLREKLEAEMGDRIALENKNIELAAEIERLNAAILDLKLAIHPVQITDADLEKAGIAGISTSDEGEKSATADTPNPEPVFENWKKADLLAYAAEKGIEGVTADNNKSEIIAKIQGK